LSGISIYIHNVHTETLKISILEGPFVAISQSQTPLRSDNSAVGGRTMRLNVTSTSNVHKELVACVGWNAFNELYSVGDDKTVSRWDINGDAGGKVRKHDRCNEIFTRRDIKRASCTRP
jgi:hypothetical protein